MIYLFFYAIIICVNGSKMNKKIIFKKASKSVVNKKTTTLQDVMAAIERWKETHKDSKNILDTESCKLRRLLYDFVTDDKIEAVAKEYKSLYIEAVIQYMKNNKYTIDDLLFVFSNTDFSNDFFPDFITFLVQYVMKTKRISKIPEVAFVKSGSKYTDFMKKTDMDDSCQFLEEHADAFYDSDTNIMYFKEDKIDNFDVFMNYVSHEISHAVDYLDASKGAFQYKDVQYYANLLYSTDNNEYKYNADEKSARKIGNFVGKNFTDKLIQCVTSNKYLVVNKENIR